MWNSSYSALSVRSLQCLAGDLAISLLSAPHGSSGIRKRFLSLRYSGRLDFFNSAILNCTHRCIPNLSHFVGSISRDIDRSVLRV
jgi:hypothetical protein